MNNSFVIEKIEEQEDGSAIITVDVSYEMLKVFAEIGFLKVLEEAAKKVLDEKESNSQAT